jgi:desumoylating isopeptidase 1
MAAQFSRQLVGKYIEGVWHTGIVIYNKEYYFGGGISYDAPGRTPFGKINQILQCNIGNPTKVLDLGFTELPEELFLEFLREATPRFTAATYNVFKHNCNNFTNECA